MSRIRFGGHVLPIPLLGLLVTLALMVGPTSTAAQGLTESAPRPEDVETLDGIVAAFYDVISTPPGGTVDWARDSTLYLDGVTFTILGREGGEWTARRVDHDAYATGSTAFLSSGFLEREIHREVHRFGAMASVFSTYEWRREEGAPPGGRGINSMELFHDGRRWWIVGVMWASEDPEHPIPEEYLPGGDGATRGAHARGVEILEGAVQALGEGVERGISPPGLVLWMTGANLQTDQSRRPEPPFDTLATEERVTFDLDGNRVAIEFRAWWPDFVRHVEQLAGPGGGLVRDFNQDTERWSEGLTAADLTSLRRRVPQVVLGDALGAVATLRHLGTAEIEGRPVEVVSYVDPGGTVASILVDRQSRLPVGVERLVDDLRHGDAAERTLWSGYRVEDGVRLPGQIRVTVAGQPWATMELDSATTSASAVEASLEPLTSARAEEGQATAPPGRPAPAVRFEEIAGGVWSVSSEAAPGYHILVVDLGTELLVAEAPAPEEATALILEEASRRFGKPVGHGVVTHHHGDHAGGVGAFLRAGIPVWTTPGNVDFVRDVGRAPRRLEGLAPPSGATDVRVVRGETSLDGTRTVVLRDVGPHPHAEEHLVVLVPEAGIVFQGDLVRFPPGGGVEPARPQTAALVALIDELDWPVRGIVGVHGRVGTVDDLRRAMEAARGEGG